MPKSFACLDVHLIFSTRHRSPQISSDLQFRLFQYIGGILNSKDCRLIAAGGMPDHVHLLVSLHRDIAVADLVRLIKANTFKWIHETFLDLPHFAWQSGYAAFAVSFSNVEDVRKYIADQADHHRVRTF
jgi:REP element-mobilizing transposase RayT